MTSAFRINCHAKKLDRKDGPFAKSGNKIFEINFFLTLRPLLGDFNYRPQTASSLQIRSYRSKFKPNMERICS